LSSKLECFELLDLKILLHEHRNGDVGNSWQTQM